MPTAANGGWALRFKHWGGGLDPRERTRVDYCEDILRGLIQHSWGSPDKTHLRSKRSLSRGPSNFPHSQMAGPRLPECQRWDDLAVVYDSRGRKASTTAVCDARAGNTSCLSARAGMGARGGGQEAAMVPTPGVSAAINLWEAWVTVHTFLGTWAA